MGWIIVQPLRIFFWQDIQNDQLSLLGTLVSFFLFLSIIPLWARIRWRKSRPWYSIGFVDEDVLQTARYFLTGILTSTFLLIVLTIFILLYSSSKVSLDLTSHLIFNAISLGLIVGIAEELIFRGWLLNELRLLLGSQWNAIIVQSFIFSIVHLKLAYTFQASLALSLGLFILGIVLAINSLLNRGSLWGCIGIHGGLVGQWFLLSFGVIKIAPDTSSLLIGPTELNSNPIGGLLTILFLTIFLASQFIALARAGRPFRGARNASCNEDFP